MGGLCSNSVPLVDDVDENGNDGGSETSEHQRPLLSTRQALLQKSNFHSRDRAVEKAKKQDGVPVTSVLSSGIYSPGEAEADQYTIEQLEEEKMVFVAHGRIQV